MNFLLIASRIADERIEGLVPSSHKSAPYEEYDEFFNQTRLPIFVIHTSTEFNMNVFGSLKDDSWMVGSVSEVLASVDGYRNEVLSDLKNKALVVAERKKINHDDLGEFVKEYISQEYELYRDDFRHIQDLKKSCVNFVVDDAEGSDKGPGWIMHDFYHMHFEGSREGGIDHGHKFIPENYLTALLNDYDFTECCRHFGITMKQFSEAALLGLHSQSLNSFYNAMVGMLEESDRSRGAAIKLFDSGEDLSASRDFLADILPIFFNPETRKGINLKLKPLYVKYHPVEEDGDVPFVTFQSNDLSKVFSVYSPKDAFVVQPKPGNHTLPELFSNSINIILDLMDDYLNRSIGKVIRVS